MMDTEIGDIRTDIGKWMDNSSMDNLSTKSLSNMSLQGVDEKSESDITDHCEYSNIYIGTVDNTELDLPTKQIEDMDISADVISEQSSPKDLEAEISDIKYKEVSIGTFTDKAISLEYCCRLIVKSFLLTGCPTNLIPDKNVRISVKSLALMCVTNIVQYYPNVLLFYLDKNGAKSVDAKSDDVKQRIADILMFIDHCDPQLRGSVICLIGNFIKAVLISAQSNYGEWLKRNCEHSFLELDNLMNMFIKVSYSLFTF